MANKGLVRKIEIASNEKNRIKAHTGFARGEMINGRFQFLTEDVQLSNRGTEKRIKELRIQFRKERRKKECSRLRDVRRSSLFSLPYIKFLSKCSSLFCNLKLDIFVI
jgi:hypothetical protein